MANVDWLSVLRGSSGAGSDTVTFAVLPNLQNSDRTGAITIAGQTFTVTQRRP
jgi:ABC-type arginine transport system ATPase subunit